MKTPEEKRRAATERQRVWRAKNHDKALASGRKSRAANIEKRREDCRRWRKENAHKAKSASARWRRDNPERVKKTSREWNRANAEKLNASRRAQYKANNLSRRIKERDRRSAIKQKLVDHMGGKCIDCGFNACLAALEFDHVNDDKERAVGYLINSSSWDRLWREARKCELVCSNCHKARHVTRIDAKLGMAP